MTPLRSLCQVLVVAQDDPAGILIVFVLLLVLLVTEAGKRFIVRINSSDPRNLEKKR